MFLLLAFPRMRRFALAGLSAAVLALAPLSAAQAHHYHSGPSDVSALSLLPVAVSVAAPVMILASGVVLSVVAVDASATGTVWVLERASDGARASVQLAGHASAGIGTAVLVTAVSAGWVISAAGEALALIPNEIGAALLYNERVTR
jgi:hypothetical protein